ncbi:peptidase M48, Ste24p [Moraxella osloensis]|uniref:Peptidase M48, Ste24p n=1 Tax=Faucicola osloensis TaxID=34062 RepID=A0AAD0EXP6_FAUOS|nr:M48 family metalloprotease [Moraxella osloensis]ATQ83764.1 peptidase M48, Ste24p [Moraxella osloensis]ATW86256.1 peptidase M48, Ste24p [Moraxella osloensis]
MPINPLASYLSASYLFRKTPVVALLSTLSTGVLAVDNFSYQSVPAFNSAMIASAEPTQVNSQLASMDNGQALIDTEQNRQVGEWAFRQINGNAALIKDPWLQQSLEQIVWQINAVAGLNAPMGLVIINDKQINAFAVPSGLIGINVGLLDKAKSLDEIVSVVAHEIAHVSQRHYQHRNDEKTKQLLMQAGGLLAGVAASKVGDGDAAAAVMLGSQAISANAAASYSRGQEREADRIGMQIMNQAGYDVNAMPSFFATLDQQNPVKSNTLIPSFILSHPLTADRISEARARVATYKRDSQANMASNRYQSIQQQRAQLFEQIQWRARYYGYLVNKADLEQGAKTSKGAKLALINYYLDNGQPKAAQSLMQDFDKDINTLANPLAVVTFSQLAAQQGNVDVAIAKLQQLASVYPERTDVPRYLSDIYLKYRPTAESGQKVLALLQPLSKQNPRNVMVWDRLQQASQLLAKHRSGDEQLIHRINTLRYRAYGELWRNELKDAVTSLTQAKSLAKQLPSNQSLLALLNQQINQVQDANQFKPS